MTEDVHYIAPGPGDLEYTPWASHSLSALVSSILEPISPAEGISQCLSLAHLLLLSNHLSQANALLIAIYIHGPTIMPSSRDTQTIDHPTLALEAFWLAHNDTHPRALNAPVIYTTSNLSPQEYLDAARWDKFRECTHTRSMFPRFNILPFQDMHSWRSSSDPRILAICCRLLAKSKEKGEYVSHDRMREALEVARKLYALPEETGELHWSQEESLRKHSAKLYRRLPLELAIKLGELEVAREILGEALGRDGLGEAWSADSVEESLMVEGVWDVLPLINAEGKKGNPYFIDGSIADQLLLERLAKGAWKENKKEYRKNGVTSWRDILNKPASEEEIQEAEEKFGELPKDFKDMCRVANGFKGGWHYLSSGISGLNGMNSELGSTELDLHESDFEPHAIEVPEEKAGEQYMIMLTSDVDCDGYEHWIIPPKLWKAILKEEVEDGSYNMWDWVGELVKEVEGTVGRGENDDGCGNLTAENSQAEGSRDEDSEAEDEDV
ncbi:hypothetical protein VTL71DRAFT_9551 [Oculimacula yallundae]|uniref:Knr4/Smi1-like domain-containing protein n=1 Tax=Oculimacula yallundae TaxID=86028 RepID=A0ABR4BSH1_9HELO